MNKVVINNCYGRFSLSVEGLKRYWELKDPTKKLYFYDWIGLDTWVRSIDESHFDICLSIDLGDSISEEEVDKKLVNENYVDRYDFSRHDPILIQVVEELGDVANGELAQLKVVTIDSDSYRIDEYDGAESVITPEMERYIKIK